ncbi:MAG TPA: DNA primase, partial [bacterium]|nr:DNA primase [bacterium]
MISSPIEEIKNRLDIIDVLSQYIKVQKVGANFRALCPFHSEKKPSFFISPSRQIWHCFGSCSEGGDIFKFVMKIEGVEFVDALKILARKAGVELKKQDPKIVSERKNLYEICDLASEFFEKQLFSTNAGKKAKEYLIKRGITEESIKKWRLGYAPEVVSGLSSFLISRGYKKEEIVKAGVAMTGRDNDLRDRFLKRIIFPVFDLNSQVVGFGGRVFLSEDIAKYVNVPNTLIYDKSRILYGLDKARMEIRKQDSVILVEGYIDAILVSQAGNENVAATSGTALTHFQLIILKRYSENILTAFDTDVAGDSATKRGIDLAISHGFNVRIVLMPKDKDPADIITEDLKQWQELIKNTRSVLEFYFETTFSKFDKKTPEGKKEISKILLPILKKIPNKIEQSHWIQKLSDELKVREEIIESELNKYKSETNERIVKDEPLLQKNKKSRKEKLEERIISLILKSPENLSLIKDEYFKYFSPDNKKVLTFLKERFFNKNFKKISDFLDSKDIPFKLKNSLNQLLFVVEIQDKDID